jgi:hypothetical protein
MAKKNKTQNKFSTRIRKVNGSFYANIPLKAYVRLSQLYPLGHQAKMEITEDNRIVISPL